MFPSFAQAQFRKRLAELERSKSSSTPSQSRTRDFLDRFLDAARIPEPPGYNYYLLTDWTLVSAMAGADTTAIGLRAMVYYLLKSPAKKARLLAELGSARLSVPVTWKQSQQLPYLDALHPGVLPSAPRPSAWGLSASRRA